MVIYADMVFLFNLCVDGLILWMTSAIRRQPAKGWRILLASALGAGYSVMHLWPVFSIVFILPLKVIVSVIMVWTAFGFTTPVAFLRSIMVFYLVSFVMGGAMFALHYFVTGNGQVAGGIFFTPFAGWGSPVSWMFVLVAFPVVWLYTRHAFRSLQERQAVHQFLVPLSIDLGGKRLECTGLIDTGNQLRDPLTRTPVILVELEAVAPFLPEELVSYAQSGDWSSEWPSLSQEWLTRVRLIPFRGAGSRGGMMIALRTDQIKICTEGRWHEVERALLGLDSGRLSADGSYHAVIHPACLPKVG